MADARKCDKPCEVCGVMMHGVSPLRKECPECKRKKQLAAVNARNKRKREERDPVRCAVCGELILGPHTNQKYHKECSKKVALKQIVESNRRRAQEKKPQAPKETKFRDVANVMDKTDETDYYAVLKTMGLLPQTEVNQPGRELTYNQVKAMADKVGMPYTDFARQLGY